MKIYILQNFETKPRGKSIPLNSGEVKTYSRIGFSIKFKRSGIKNKLRNVNKYEDLPCEISFHSFLDQTKAIFYFQTYGFHDKSEESQKI